MRALLLVLFLLCSLIAFGESLGASLAVTPAAAASTPSAAALRDAVGRLFASEYGRFCTLSFGREDVNDATAVVTVDAAAAGLTVSTDLTRGGTTRSLVSTVPAGSPSALVAAATADISWLYFLSLGFTPFPLDAAPSLTGVIDTDTLASLVGGNPGDLAPVGLVSSDDGVTLCLAHGYITLGPGFRVTETTARDIAAQAGGREKSQLAGIAVGKGGDIVLVSDSDATIIRTNARVATRATIAAPGINGALARLAGPATLAYVVNGGPTASVALRALDGEASRTVPVACPYVSAMAVDREGNIWAWDATERRIRILTIEGREVFTIRPLFNASIMQLPQQLVVLGNGGFLLAGSGEVWRFESTGIPVWRLTRIPGRPGEQLPASFSLAAADDGSVTIMDGPSRRLLGFSQAPTADLAALSALLTRLDTRREADVHAASAAALGAGLSLMAWQLADRSASAAVPPAWALADRAAARQSLLRDLGEQCVRYADSLRRELLFSRADAAYLKAADIVRELSAEYPGDDEAPSLLTTIVSRRRDVRDALAGAPGLDVVSVSAEETTDQGFKSAVTLRVRLRNAGAAGISEVRLHAALPGVADSPVLAGIDAIASGEEKEIDAAIVPDGPLPPRADAALLLTWQAGGQGLSSATLDAVTVVAADSPAARAARLARAAAPNDVLLSDLVSAVPGQPNGGDAAAFVASLGALTSLRGPSDGTPTGAALRAALRGLSPDPAAWAVVTASLAGSLGLGSGFAASERSAYALVDTGVPLATALKAVPGLASWEPLLTTLSRAGTLCVPLAGSAGGADSLVTTALQELVAAASVAVAWVDLKALPPPAPRLFPLALPLTVAQTSGALTGGIISLMEQTR